MAAVVTTKEKWCEAEVNRVAGETILKSPEPDIAKVQDYFERALAIARQQQAKSWKLHAAMARRYLRDCFPDSEIGYQLIRMRLAAERLVMSERAKISTVATALLRRRSMSGAEVIELLSHDCVQTCWQR